MADVPLMNNPMTTQDDIVIGGASGAPTRLAKGTDGQRLTVDPSTHHLVWADPSEVSEILDIPTAETDTSLVLAPDGAGGVEFRAEAGGGGGSLSTVVQDIAADFTTASDSAWHDVTGMTGISLTAGTWIAYVDVETAHSGTFGPAFRVSDGTTIYAQAGWLLTNPGTTLSNHLHFASKPFVLGGSATMKLQVFSDTAFTVKKYPSRGGDSSVVATHITFLQIA